MKKALFYFAVAAVALASCKKEEKATEEETVVPAPVGSMTLGDVMWASVNVDGFQQFATRPDMHTKLYQWNKTTAYSASNPLTPAWNSTANNSTTWTVNP